MDALAVHLFSASLGKAPHGGEYNWLPDRPIFVRRQAWQYLALSLQLPLDFQAFPAVAGPVQRALEGSTTCPGCGG